MPPAQLMQAAPKLMAIGKRVDASQALVVIADNYGACKATADRLAGLQAWVAAMSRKD